MDVKIGVLAFQGAIDEHLDMLNKCNVKAIKVKKVEDLNEINGLILPGGESTTIGSFLERKNMIEPIKKFAKKGYPVMGTCAGLVLLAKQVEDQDKAFLQLMDITVKRNAFGRQKDSFELYLDIPEIGKEEFKGVFIRAPLITKTGDKVKELCSIDGKIVAVREKNLIVGAFHPELTDDIRWHKYFVNMSEYV